MSAAHLETDSDSAGSSLGDLVRRIAGGDREAEAAFVRRFEPGIRALARRHARPRESRVADVVQDVLLHALQRLRAGALSDPQALPGYLRTMVVRAVQALYRGSASDRLVQDDVPVERVAAVAGVETPERQLADAQLRDAMRHAMSELPTARDREILVRFYVQEEPKESLCAALGIDEAHFRRVLFRARERLRDLVRGRGGS